MKNIIAKILILIASSCLLIACSSKQEETIEATTTPTTNEPANEESKDSTADNNDEQVYKVAYQTYIAGLQTSEESIDDYTYALIYLDDDDIPELFVNTNVDATAARIVSVHDGVGVDEIVSCSSEYIESSGLIKSNFGSMDYYTTSIFKLEGGQFTLIGVGVQYLSDEALEARSNDEDYSWTYEWADENNYETVSEEEFNGYMNALYEIGSGKTIEATYNTDEILELLK